MDLAIVALRSRTLGHRHRLDLQPVPCARLDLPTPPTLRQHERRLEQPALQEDGQAYRQAPEQHEQDVQARPGACEDKGDRGQQREKGKRVLMMVNFLIC